MPAQTAAGATIRHSVAGSPSSSTPARRPAGGVSSVNVEMRVTAWWRTSRNQMRQLANEMTTVWNASGQSDALANRTG